MNIRISNLKWDFYALFGLPIYAPFTLSDEEVIECMFRFYLKNKQITNRQLLSLFSVAFVTLTFFKEEYDHDLQRRNAFITQLANKYAHCADKDRRIHRGLCFYIPRFVDLQIVIYGMWEWYKVVGKDNVINSY
jgi:hypothetical protein